MSAGELIKKWRLSVNLSQRQLAEAINQKINQKFSPEEPGHFIVHQADVQKAESGSGSPYIMLKVVNALYDFMGVERGSLDAPPASLLAFEEASADYHTYDAIQIRDKLIRCQDDLLAAIKEIERLRVRVAELENAP